jgi:hypothetical protein
MIYLCYIRLIYNVIYLLLNSAFDHSNSNKTKI